MIYLPHEQLDIKWKNNQKSFCLSLPWVSMEIDVSNEDKTWVANATQLLFSSPTDKDVQKFLKELERYPIYYIKPRSIEDFDCEKLQSCHDLFIDFSTPKGFLESFGCGAFDNLLSDLPSAWCWDQKKILSKSQIPETNLYDPISFISYLICYRQDWESDKWSGEDGLGKFLLKFLEKDEEQFFQAIGWVVKQSLYVTSEACEAMEPALVHFSKAQNLLDQYISEEIGHDKFMERVFVDLDLDQSDFPVGEATRWSIAALERTATISPLAFSAFLNLFEAAYYEGEDPISKIIRLSSKPYAAKGYDLHYKINEDHRHCDMPIKLAAYLGPQTNDHATLTLCLFELTLHLLDSMERELAASFDIC